ncbi:MAG: hypothetical protein RLZZ44_167 [Bacteroidota bacterium]|jgi:hypothetical protein
MLQKVIQYFVAILVIGLVLYNSVYFKKISEMQLAKVEAAFDATAYSKTYLFEKIPNAKQKSVLLADLILALNTDSNKAFKDFGHSQNQGDTKYFFVKGEGVITGIDDEFITLKETSSGTEVKVAIQYIFGNTARDCSGIIAIDDFSNTMDLNTVSETINKIIKTEIVAPFITEVKKGSIVSYIGGIELIQSDLKKNNFEIIPLGLEIKSK